MATTHLSAQSEPFRGVRPLNLSRDTTQVVRLLNLVFGPGMEQEGQRLLDGSAVTSSSISFITRLSQLAQGVPPGFVWEENKRLVGNVSLMSSPVVGRYLIANVAVHPDFRRRGIARSLMDATLQAVAQKRGRAVLLQVRDDNQEAIRLYESLGFAILGTTTTWQTSASRLQEIAVAPNGPTIRPVRQGEWEAAMQLDRAVSHPDLDWPEPIAYDYYRGGFWRWFYNFMNGRQVETWTTTRQGQLLGVAQITAEFGSPHRLRVRVLPEWQMELTRPLLAKLLRRLNYMRYRSITIEHAAADEAMTLLLQRAGFKAVRTLAMMKHELRTYAQSNSYQRD